MLNVIAHSRSFAVVVLLLFSQISTGMAGEPEDRVVQIKAAMLLNLGRLAEWPESAFLANSDKRFKICIVGDGAPYRKILDKQLVGNRKIVVIEIVWGEVDLPPCHILFVPAEREKDFPDILKAAKHQPIMTVGDFADATRLNGMIAIIRQDDKLKLDINNAAIQASQIKFREVGK
jgi:YfiR/HmsC-like